MEKYIPPIHEKVAKQREKTRLVPSAQETIQTLRAGIVYKRETQGNILLNEKGDPISPERILYPGIPKEEVA